MEDLANWAESGYGNPLNYRIAAPLLQDMVARFDGVIDDPKLDELAYMRFAHAETVR